MCSNAGSIRMQWMLLSAFQRQRKGWDLAGHRPSHYVLAMLRLTWRRTSPSALHRTSRCLRRWRASRHLAQGSAGSGRRHNVEEMSSGEECLAACITALSIQCITPLQPWHPSSGHPHWPPRIIIRNTLPASALALRMYALPLFTWMVRKPFLNCHTQGQQRGKHGVWYSSMGMHAATQVSMTCSSSSSSNAWHPRAARLLKAAGDMFSRNGMHWLASQARSGVDLHHALTIFSASSLDTLGLIITSSPCAGQAEAERCWPHCSGNRNVMDRLRRRMAAVAMRAPRGLLSDNLGH